MSDEWIYGENPIISAPIAEEFRELPSNLIDKGQSPVEESLQPWKSKHEGIPRSMDETK